MTEKITYIITRSDIGGAQNHVHSLLKYFSKRFELVLISGSDGALLDTARDLGIKVHVVQAINSYKIFHAIFALRKILRQENPNLVHTHSSLASLYGRVAAKMIGAATVYTVHGWHFANLRNNPRKHIQISFERLLKSLTSRWILVSEFDLELGSKHDLFKSNAAEVIVNGIKDVELRANRAVAKQLKLVFIGRASIQKNCSAAIKVMEGLNADFSLTMYVSGGAATELAEHVKLSKAAKRISVVLDEPNASRFLHNFDVMISTSRYEGMPLSVIEGLRAGLPIIATNVCGMNELVKSENGYLTELDDVDAMRDKIIDLHRNRCLLFQMGIASRALYEEHYVDTIMLDKTHQLYNKLLST